MGNASKELIQHSSESLAGRIGYHYLGGFRIANVGGDHLQRLWIQGAIPKAYTLEQEAQSYLWRDHYISTLLERDLSQLGIRIPSDTMRRFWKMLTHYHGQILNFSELATARPGLEHD